MTYRQARKIQAAHLKHYSNQLNEREAELLRERIAARTIANNDPDEEFTIREINKMVPRGKAIELEADKIRKHFGSVAAEQFQHLVQQL